MKIILIILINITLFASVKQNMLELYKNNDYQTACNVGYNNIKTNMNDEEFLSLYAFSCLKSDYINRLAIPITKLKFTPEARANSSYFSIILMQKRLLTHALIDGYDLYSLNLPTTNYILSKVFDFYVKLDLKIKKDFYIFKDKKDDKITYKLYIKKNYKLDKIIIEEYYNKKLIKQHIYW